MSIQDRINRIRMESQMKFKVVEEYIEARQQMGPQEARNMIIARYMPQAEMVLEIMGPRPQVPALRDRFTQSLNQACNEAESIFFELAQMR